MLRTILTILMFVFGVAYPTQATEDNWEYFYAREYTPVAQTVVIEAPYYAWGIRPSAAYLDARIETLDMIYYRGVSCEDYPMARCVRVELTTLDYNVYGRTTFDDWFNVRIQLNTQSVNQNNRFVRQYYPRWRRSVAMHELLHTFGMDHHGDGLIAAGGDMGMIFPTAEELAALQTLYGER